MRLEQLEIENFKCFKSKKTFDFGRITVLTGANSSGKSTVMQAVLGAVQTDGFPFYYSPNGKYINLGDFKEMANVNSKNESISINLKKQNYDKIETYWAEDETNFLPKLKYVKLDNKGVKGTIEFIEEEKLKISLEFPQHWNFESIENDIESISYKYEVKYYWNEEDNVLVLLLSNKILNEDSFYDGINFKNNFVFIGMVIHGMQYYFPDTSDREEYFNYIGPYRSAPLRTYLEKNKLDLKVGVEGEGYIDQIVDWEKRSNGKIKKLVEVLKDLDLLEEIKVNRLSGGRFELLVRAKNSQILTSLTNVGFGVSQFLPIIVADLQLSDNSTLFLAEPEIHLHPSIQAKFADYLIKQITTTEKNYVIETHSEYFLNRLRLAIVKGELKKEDFKIYFLENNGEDTEVFDIDFTKTGAIKNVPKNFFETYYVDSMDIALNAFDE